MHADENFKKNDAITGTYQDDQDFCIGQTGSSLGNTKWAEWFMGNIICPPLHGLMEAVQLKTIRRYAERTAG